MMGIKLITEVLDYAPAALTPPERLLLVALAETARDGTRMCWPGMATLTRRTGLSDRHVRRVLTELGQRGYEVRVQSGVDKNGQPVFASKGHRTVYQVPVFRQRGTPTAALKEDAHVRLSDPKVDTPGTQRRTPTVAKEDIYVPPSPQEPSKQPSNHRADDEIAVVIDALRNRTGKIVDGHHATLVIKQLVDGRDVDRIKYLRGAIAKDLNPTRFLPTPVPPPYRP